MSNTRPQTQEPRCPLRREGAMILLSPAEQALEDARSRSTTPLPPVSSVSANSQLRRTGRMGSIPVAGSGQLLPSTDNSIVGDARPQNPQRNRTPQPDGNNNAPTVTTVSPDSLSQLSSGAISIPSATPSAFDPDNLYKVKGRILFNFRLFD